MTDLRKQRAIPPTAWAIIQATAEQYEVADPASLLVPGRLDTEMRAARRLAITRLSNEELDGKKRYPISKLQAWFDVSRASINRDRSLCVEYVPRRDRKARDQAPT